MRQKLAREPFAEKIRKVAQLIRLAKTFPRRTRGLRSDGRGERVEPPALRFGNPRS